MDRQCLNNSEEILISEPFKQTVIFSTLKYTPEKNKSRQSRKNRKPRQGTEISDRIGKYDVVEELARAPIGMSLG